MLLTSKKILRVNIQNKVKNKIVYDALNFLRQSSLTEYEIVINQIREITTMDIMFKSTSDEMFAVDTLSSNRMVFIDQYKDFDVLDISSYLVMAGNFYNLWHNQRGWSRKILNSVYNGAFLKQLGFLKKVSAPIEKINKIETFIKNKVWRRFPDARWEWGF